MRRRLRDSLISVAIFAAIIGIWYLAAYFVRSSGDPGATNKLPYLHEVIRQISVSRSSMKTATWITLKQAVFGFAIGSAIGFLLSIVMVQARWIESSLMPYALGAQMIPLVALVPIARTIFHDNGARLFMASFVTFFSVNVASVRGLRSAPPGALDLMRLYGSGRIRLLRHLLIPGALPYLFAGLRIAAPLSVVGSIIVDLTGAQEGLGYIMLNSLTYGQGLLLWAALLITLVLGFGMSQVVVIAERMLTPWQLGLRSQRA